MNEELKIRVEEFMNSETGEAIKSLVAFTIRKTKTVKDDEVLDSIEEVAAIIAENIQDISEQHPTDKEAKDSAMKILKVVVENTENKTDDRLFKILDLFL